MEKSMLADVGENFEYLKIIAANKLEIKKLELTQDVSKVVGNTVLGILLFSISLFIIAIIVAIGVVLLAQAFDSVLFGLLAAGLIILFMAILLYIFRQQLVFRFVSKLLLSIVTNDKQQ